MKKFICGLIVGILLMTMIPVSAVITDYILHKAEYAVVINGEQYIDADLPILNWNGYTYAPLRSMLTAAGCKIDWDGDARIASVINTAMAEAPKETIYAIGDLIEFENCMIKVNSVTTSTSHLLTGGKTLFYASQGQKYALVNMNVLITAEPYNTEWIFTDFLRGVITADEELRSLPRPFNPTGTTTTVPVNVWTEVNIAILMSENDIAEKVVVQNPALRTNPDIATILIK